MPEGAPITVLMVVTWPLSHDTGYTVNARRTIDSLRRAGHRVRVCQVVHRSQVPAATAYESDDDEARSFIAPFDRAVPVGGPLLRSMMRSGLRTQIAETNAAVVHARGLRAGALVAELGLPVVLDVRGDAVAESEVETAEWPARKRERHLRQMRAIEQAAFASADAMAVVSDAMLEWARQHGPRLASLPCAVIPCAVEVDAFGVRERRARPAADGTFVAVYSGGFQAYQPAETVFDELSRVGALVPGARLQVLTADRRESIEAVRDARCPSASIERLSAADAAAWLSRADLGLIPRVDHPANRVSCPTKIAEYLAAGVPVAASRHLGHWARRLEEWDVGVAIEADDDELEAFIARVRAERDAFARRCRGVAREHFSIETTVERLESLYTAVLAEASGA